MLTILLCLSLSADPAEMIQKREAFLTELRGVLPANRPFEEWLESAKELPPDFDAMPDYAPLPDPLERLDAPGEWIRSAEEWPAQRQALLAAFQQWVIGSVPPAPDNLEATVLTEQREEGATVREVELRFGPGHAAKVWLQLYIPHGPGPFPVFMTQDNHRPWGLIALRRGYLVCVYAGSDSRDDTDTFSGAYPEYDFSKLARRAWAASRCIDFLASVPQADMDRIAITGHSRNGKLSLIASALDERIACVISSCSGAGGSLPTRYYSEHTFGEGIENITRNFTDWFHPRWRFFTGREHKLPVDLHTLVALSAPRPCLLSIALNDNVECSWTMQQTYLEAMKAYKLTGAEDKLRILWRPFGHETWPTVIEYYLDWCDLQFGRGKAAFPERLIHPWDWEGWRTARKNPLDSQNWPKKESLRDNVLTMLGTSPPGAAGSLGTYGREPAHIEQLLSRSDAGSRLEKHDLVFGEYINADVYMPEGTQEAGEKIPGVIWLHPWCTSRGYVAAYRRGEQAFRTIARAGYAVFCFDQTGFGRRIEEVERFYIDYPDWSLLGKMLRDTQAALDVMHELPYIDTDKIYIVGYGLGAMIGLHLAAIDERPAGYALDSPPPPFRLDTDVARTGGFQRWAQLHMLLPNLGLFTEAPERIPYDVDGLLAAMAPRPVLVHTGRLNRNSPPDLLERAVAEARPAFVRAGAEKQLEHAIPAAYDHFDTTQQNIVVDWLKRIK